MIGIVDILEKIPGFKSLPYPISGAIIRGVKAFLSVTVGLLLAAATAGTLLPATTAPYIVALVTLTLQALDKYVREQKIAGENEGDAPKPLGDNPPPELQP